ncbi:MAG: anion transporter [Planctomyces sp.]|nr:anion transporter [Planctomyces sp.]
MVESTMVDSQSAAEPIRYRLIMTLLAAVLATGICLVEPPAGLSPAGQRLGAVVVAMALLWSTQAWPLAVTSLLPLAAFPLLQIQAADEVSKAYMSATILLYFSGFAIAIGVERWGLHERLALFCLRVLGTGPRRIVFAFMFGTALISMWISNTAAALLMLPIALAVLPSISQASLAGKGGEDPAAKEQASNREQRFAVALLLGIAYAASIGGICTLIGTPTNGVYAGYWASAAADRPEIAAKYAVSSGQWFLMFTPISIFLFAAAWMVLCFPLERRWTVGEEAREYIGKRYAALGSMDQAEWAMLGVFIGVAFLWLTRASVEIGSVTLIGWEVVLGSLLSSADGSWDYSGWLHDSTAGLLMMTLMFVIPVRPRGQEHRQFLMDWESIEAKTPWGILLLFGGGFAIAGACSSTGLSAWLGDVLADQLAGLGDGGRITVVTTFVIFLTEFTSNTATIATLLPILESTANSLSLDPRLLMLPATVAASCAFMLPIATPPNAIVFSSNRLTVWQMIKAGLWLNLLSVAVVVCFTLFWVLRVASLGN